jgi:hypothetical protein
VSEDKSKKDDAVEEKAEDEGPDVEAHRFKARTIEGDETADEADRFKARRPSGL